VSDLLPYNNNPPRRHAAPPPVPRQVASPAPVQVEREPVYQAPRREGGGLLRLIAIIVLAYVLVFPLGGLNILSGFLGQAFVMISPPLSGDVPDVQLQMTSVPSGSGRLANLPTPLPPINNGANCSPASIFSVGLTAVVDLASTSGASTRIAAWTQPGGGIHNSDAEPGMKLNIVGGPQCAYNSEYRQYIRYWQVEFTNRNGRYIAGDAWVGESIWEGSYVNYLICRTSEPDC